MQQCKVFLAPYGLPAPTLNRISRRIPSILGLIGPLGLPSIHPERVVCRSISEPHHKSEHVRFNGDPPSKTFCFCQSVLYDPDFDYAGCRSAQPFMPRSVRVQGKSKPTLKVNPVRRRRIKTQPQKPNVGHDKALDRGSLTIRVFVLNLSGILVDLRRSISQILCLQPLFCQSART